MFGIKIVMGYLLLYFVMFFYLCFCVHFFCIFIMFMVMYLLSSMCHLIKDSLEDYLNCTVEMTEKGVRRLRPRQLMWKGISC